MYDNPETAFVTHYNPTDLLDAGCGTGRIAIELAGHGIDVVGVDFDSEMLAKARGAAPNLSWYLGDLAAIDLKRRFSVVLLAGNVITYLRSGTESAVVENTARHLAKDGLLVSGFQLSMDRSRITLEEFDRLTQLHGLALTERYSGWDRSPWRWDSPFVVSVHRRTKPSR